MKKSALALAALLLLAPVPVVSAQNITLRYGQIPSTIKTVSALHFYIAQRKGFFSREGITLEMLPIEGGACVAPFPFHHARTPASRYGSANGEQEVLR